MSAAKSTPGPWYAEDRGERHVILAEGYDYEIAEVVCDQTGACSRDSEGDENAAADACLIAAAPELLDVVETWMRSMQKTWPDGPPITHPLFDLYNWAKSAAAKARGGA